MSVKVPTISIEELLKEKVILVDVRSPAEFEEFHIPGAINIPLFSNEERAKIGTIYKQVGQKQAIELGVQFFSKKLPEIFQQFQKVVNENDHKNIVVYCWRGGMRSGTIVSFLGSIKFPVIQLEGGIRSYRKLIQKDLDEFSKIQKRFIVLEGNTGTHKTEILKRLQQENYPTINLEELAGHRGSIFGAIGLNPNSQKEFERKLWQRLWELKDAPYYIIEAESKRIGRIVIPDFILKGKEQGTRIHIVSSLESRIKAICDTYRFHEFHEQFVAASTGLKKRLKPELFQEIQDRLHHKEYEQFVKLLLENYYDPKYHYAQEKYETPARIVVIEGMEDGLDIIKNEINTIVEKWGIVPTINV